MKDKRQLSRRKLLQLGMAAGGAGLVGSGMARAAGAEDAAASKAAETGAGKAAAGDAAGKVNAEEVALPQVPRRTLGKTGASVPILLMGGAMGFDSRFDPKLAEGLRFGVNYIDAADCYAGGQCEVSVGNFHTRADLRKDLWITSKSDEHGPKGFESTLHASLEKLKTDWIDMYFLHALQDASYLNDDLLATVERLKKEGKIRHFGFSCHHDNVAELLHKAAELGWVETVMFRYNFRKYGDKELNEAIDACAKANVGLIAMKTQGSEASFADAWKKFESTGKWTKHQAVLKAVWEDDRIHAAVSHMDTFEKLKQNIAAALDREKLGTADHEALEEYAAATRSDTCDGCDRFCGSAVGAPVQIGTTMRYLMYHDVYGEKAKARELFGKLPPEARRLGDVDFAAANAACPHGVDVAHHMKRAARIFRA